MVSGDVNLYENEVKDYPESSRELTGRGDVSTRDCRRHPRTSTFIQDRCTPTSVNEVHVYVDSGPYLDPGGVSVSLCDLFVSPGSEWDRRDLS